MELPQARRIEKKERERGHLFGHLVLEDGGTVEHLHCNALPGLGVLRELDLGKGAFPNGPPHFVLAHTPQRPAANPHHLHSSARVPTGDESARPLAVEQAKRAQALDAASAICGRELRSRDTARSRCVRRARDGRKRRGEVLNGEFSVCWAAADTGRFLLLCAA
jgi:hypothetical protein